MVIVGPTPTARMEEGDHEIGFVWAHPFLPEFANSYGMNLPWLSQMIDAKERPPMMDDFCREVSRAMPMGYLLEQLQQDPIKTIGGLIGPLAEAMRALTHWRDLEISRKGKQPLVVANDSRRAALEREKVAWRAKWEREKAKSTAADVEVQRLSEKVKELGSLLEEYNEYEKQQRKDCTEHMANLKAARETLKNKEAAFAERENESQALISHLWEETRLAKEEAAKAGEEAIDAFLNSEGFRGAAMVSMTQMMRDV